MSIYTFGFGASMQRRSCGLCTRDLDKSFIEPISELFYFRFKQLPFVYQSCGARVAFARLPPRHTRASFGIHIAIILDILNFPSRLP
jgi:hypothetical protein